jgi:dihydrolipoamide dehydrogenase
LDVFNFLVGTVVEVRGLSYDIVVIGSGPGGEVGAIRASQLGMKVAIVEKRSHLGGTCLNVGCIPTKSLLSSAKVFKKVLSAQKYGIKTGSVSFDWTKIISRKEDIVNAQRKGLRFLMKKNKIDTYTGTASLKSATEVEIKNGKEFKNIKTKYILLATGSKVKSIPGFEVDDKVIYTSDSILDIEKIPKSLAVIGGGIIGVEFASLFNTFATEVTIFELLPRIVPGEDSDCSKELTRVFKKNKIEIKTGTKLLGCKRKNNQCVVSIEGEDDHVFESALVAIGRSPVYQELNLDKVGVALESGFIKVSNHYQTTVDNIFAIGDIINTPALAHTASAEAIHAVETIVAHPSPVIDYRKNPSAVYSIPEVASLGQTEDELKKIGQDYKVSKFPFSPMAKAKIEEQTSGFIKILYEPKYKEILGVHIVGESATEIISEFVLGQVLETTIDEIGYSIHPHPTMSETVMEAAHGGMGGAIHL